jgi:hypothetical protein
MNNLDKNTGDEIFDKLSNINVLSNFGIFLLNYHSP